jgi:hypothetical protein
MYIEKMVSKIWFIVQIKHRCLAKYHQYRITNIKLKNTIVSIVSMWYSDTIDIISPMVSQYPAGM